LLSTFFPNSHDREHYSNDHLSKQNQSDAQIGFHFKKGNGEKKGNDKQKIEAYQLQASSVVKVKAYLDKGERERERERQRERKIRL